MLRLAGPNPPINKTAAIPAAGHPWFKDLISADPAQLLSVVLKGKEPSDAPIGRL